MPTWVVAAILLIIAWAVLAGIPGAPVKGKNRIILSAGCLIIVVGYILLSQGPWDNPLSLTWAPLLLVAGYCVLIPIALLRRQSSADDTRDRTSSRPAR